MTEILSDILDALEQFYRETDGAVEKILRSSWPAYWPYKDQICGDCNEYLWKYLPKKFKNEDKMREALTNGHAANIRYQKIRSLIGDIYRKETTKHKRPPATQIVYLSELATDVKDPHYSPEEIIITEEKVSVVKNIIKTKLNETEKVVLARTIEGYTGEEIAKELKTTKKNVFTLRNRAIGKIKAFRKLASEPD